ncbi:MAG: OmpH family outer membrane protein [Nitrospirota bacterium]|jgi:outer membrane protein
MRKALVFLLALALAGTAYAADKDLKIGFVNLQKALNESESGVKTKAELEDRIKENRAKIQEKVKKKEALQKELERQSTALSEAAVQERKDEIQRLDRDIERMVSDANTELQKLQRQKEVSILKDLDAIISSIGKEGGYTIILPSDVILYSREGVDITNTVIERYDKIYKEKQAAKPAP